MTVKPAKMKDLPAILEIYAYARNQMVLNGNPTQWGSSHPAAKILVSDIEKKNLYLIEANSKAAGVFAFIAGEEPTYRKINGAWINDLPYGTIHRAASGGIVRGILHECLNYCESLLPNIRIDTHSDNVIMQHLLEKEGFHKCGVIHVEDGTPRIAYQRMRRTSTK